MKQYPEEQGFLKAHLAELRCPEFSSDQETRIALEVSQIRKSARLSPWGHNFMELLPFALIASLWYGLIFVLPEYIPNKALLFVCLFSLHGFLGYQWVVYGLHEGAGHGLFKNQKTLLHRTLNAMAFHSSRLMMADPVNYRSVHLTHHRHTGTEKDEAQTNFVLMKRIMVSLLPGAGILFPNDYRIHKGDDLTLSQLASLPIGLARFALEYHALKPYFSLIEILVMLFLLSPWVGLLLDRIRESLEHHLMPQSRIYGARELGSSALALLIAGGPWGQPYHFTHHLAPDLNWYQQFKLHRRLERLLTEEQLIFFGFTTRIQRLIADECAKHMRIERKPKDLPAWN